MTYTDSTIQPFGKFKGMPISQVPAATILWYLENIPNLHQGFKDYINENKNRLELQAAADKQRDKAQHKLNRK